MKGKITLLILAVVAAFNSKAANYFWVGGSGSWSNYAAHWATTSGGTVFHTQVPQSTDNVYFDANSFSSTNQTVTVDQPVVQCADMNWNGVTKNPAFSGDYTNTLKIYGSLILSSGMDFTFEGAISFEATVLGKTITTAGRAINATITFKGAGGGWTLLDALTANWIYLSNGTLNTNNQTVNAYSFTSTTSTTRVLNLGTSTFNLSFYGPMWNINPVGMTMNATSSTIKGVATSGGAQDFYGGGFTYNNVLFIGSQAGKINGNSIINNVSFAADGYIQCNCTFNDVNFSGDAFFTSGSTFNNVTVSKSAEFTSSNTFNNLTLSPDQTYKLQSGQTQTINTSLTASGNCGALIDIQSSVPGSQSTIAKASGSVTLAYVTLRDIKAIGGAAFTANHSSDMGNNSGWTVNSDGIKNLYWVGNGGNWNDGNHWSLTSGGTPAGCSPTPMDNVFFDGNSFSAQGQVVTVNVPVAAVNNMVWTGVTNAPAFYGDYSSTLKIFGSLKLATGVLFDFTGPLSFESNITGQTITTAGVAINTSITFNGAGVWTLQDNLTCNYWIYFNNGTLTTNNKTVNAYSFNSVTSNTRVLNMGSSIFNLSFNGSIWNINPTGITINAGTSVIYGVGFSGGEQYFKGGGFTYNDVQFIGAALGKIIDSNTMHNVSFGADGFIQGGTFNNVNFMADATLYYTNICNRVSIAKNATILNSNTFNTLQLTSGYTYTLAAGETQTINDSLKASGSCGGLIEIRSSVPGTPTTIKKTTGTVNLSYVSLKDINVTGGASFIANNLNNLGNNLGWATNLLTPLTAKNLYWVGNSGNWDDGSHWALTSGGTPAGCSPTSIDNAFFDANSFTLTGQTITVNVPAASVKSMVWTGVTKAPTFYGDFANTLKIYGSLTLSQGVILDFTGPIIFESTNPGQTITSAGTVINTSLQFNGIGGSWTLQDELKCNYWIYLNNGTLNTNNKTVNAYALSSITNMPRTLNMGSSIFNLSFNGLIWDINPVGMTVNAGTSTINGVGASGGQQDFEGGGFTYNNISFIGSALGKIVDNNIINDVVFNSDGFIQGGTFHDITFSGNATMYYTNICHNVSIAKNADILGSNTFYFLKLSPGYTYTLTAGETQTILSGGNICAEGTGSLPIRIQSSDDGVPTTISKTSGTVCWDYVRISDLKAIGGATFNAGLAPVNSQDMGGNTGFIYTGTCFPLGCAPCVAPVITTQPANTSSCIGTAASFTVAASGSVLTYQWQVLVALVYVNVNNVAPYSGATTNTLNVAATALLNGSKFRCVVSGTCGNPITSNVATLTVNASPVASSSVNGSNVTVSATGGTAPYSGTGVFTVSASGTYTYTVTDAKGCSASTTATVTVTNTDNIPPVAKCKNATVTLVNGTATLAASAVNNGSTDNVGITSITVAPSTFTCANIGANTVTLTVKDAKGNTSTCQSTVTVVGSIPAVTISQGALPDFWQGGAVVLTANVPTGSTCVWNTGETTTTKNVYASGTSTINVKNAYGCTASKSYTVSYSAASLLSSYTVLAKEGIILEDYSYVQSGGAGVLKSTGDIDVKSYSKITGVGTFAAAKYINVATSAVVTQKICSPAAVALPVYRYNPYCESTYSSGSNGNNNCNDNSWYYYGNSCNNNSNNNYYNYYGNNSNSNNNNCNNNNNYNNNNCNNNNWSSNNCNNSYSNYSWGNNNCNNNSSSCNQSNRDKTVGNNATVTLGDSIYSDIVIGSNATVTFSQPIVYIKSITTGSNTKINFVGCTEIKVCGKVVIGEYNIFNQAAKGVVIYSDEEVEIKKGASFTGSVYTRKDLQTTGTSSARVTMKGMFIANKVKSNYTSWNWNNANTGCNFTRSAMVESADEDVTEGAITNNMDVNVFPNPSADNFSVVLNSESIVAYSVKVIDMAGRLVYSIDNVEAVEVLSFGKELQKGIYLMTLTQGYSSKTLRVIKTE